MGDTVNVVDRTTGQTFGVPADQLAAYTSAGFRPETDEEAIDRNAAETFHAEHGGIGGAIGSAITGGLSGLTLGASDLALSGLGADRMVRHMESEHPYATGGGMVAGALLPTVLTGGAAAGEEAAGLGARILAHSPAGLAGKVGHAVSGLGEGAGLAGRIAAGTAGAAAEGALYGGGQYLTETALEDKPLSAEGFVAGMGHGALFAAPIGGVGTLASATLQRAASLFPRSEVSAAAAAGVKEQASGALAQTVRDGDAMVQAAERRLSDIDAGTGMAQAGESATRRVFGGADPQAIADQVTGATARQEVSQALEGYQQARTQFEDWVANEADPAFAAAFGKLEENRPALDRMLAHADQGDLDDLLGTMRGGSRDERLQTAMRRTLDEPDVLGTGGIPIGEFGAPGARGVKTPEELQRALEGSAPEAAPALAPEDATGAGGPRALRAQGTPAGRSLGEVAAEQAPVPLEQPATAVGKRPAAAAEPARTAVPVGFDVDATSDGDRVFNKNPEIKTGVPKFEDLNWARHRDEGYVIRPSDLQDLPGDKLRGITSGDDMLADARTNKIRAAWERGESVPAIEIDVDKAGHYFVGDGNHRLIAAALDGDRPILARFRPIEIESGNMDRIGGDLARALGRKAAPGGDDLIAALSGTKSAIDKGTELVDIGGKEAAATRAEQLLRHPDTAERFLVKAGARDAAESFRTKAAGPDLDAFFRDLTAPKTRDAYVAANIQRAMREEGSHAAALAKVEREWGERITAELREERAAAEPEVGDATMGRILAKHGLGETAPAAAATPAGEPDTLAARILRNEGRPSAIAATAPVSDASVAGEGKLAGPMTKAEIAEQRARFRAVAPEQRAARAIMRHNGKGVDMGPALAREAKVIGDMEGASARLADALGSEAPPTAVTSAKAFHEATAKAQERAAASSAKLGADLQNKVPAMTGGTDASVVDDDVAKALRKHESRAAAASAVPAAGATSTGLGGKAADLGSALEVMRAIGMHVPAISHIPVIGPILGLWLKARAVMSILGRKGGSIGKSTEGLIAGKAAAVQDRIVKATGALLDGGARAAGRASHLAGPAVLLAGSLFPGGEKSKSDNPRELFAARSDDITRAMQPGAIDQAIAQRFPTSDPAMHDAIVAQVQRGIAFLDSKRPKQTVLPGVLPGDGTWKPSMAAIEEFGKYVHAVNDPVSVLEDLAKGHPSAEGAETLRVVYPQIYQYAQKQLLAAAPEMARTLPYPRRVMLSILYQIPVDGTMQPSHAQFLQTPAPAGAPKAPATTGPLRLGQQTLSPLDQRAAGA